MPRVRKQRGIHTTRETIETWCKKYAHLLIFSGTLIVFATVIVKEIPRENWKDTADAIENARHVQGMHVQMGALQKEVDRANENVGRIVKELIYKIPESASDKGDLVYRYIDSADSRLDNVRMTF